MCFYPMQALKLDSKTKNGKSVIRFIKKQDAHKFKGNPNLLEGLPCGQCTDCRLNRSKEWAIRCMHEADLHKENCFITLTFDEEHLLKRVNPMSLDKRDFQLFMKRLRKRVPKIKFYMCGEYGELTRRPHYHACIFGYDFPDKKLYTIRNGNRLYTSDILSELWPLGFSTIGSLTFDSAAYVSRYIMKKALGKNAWKNYFEYVDEQTGELIGLRLPEYTTMSRRSGIGKEWLVKHFADVYTGDKIFRRGKGFIGKPPKYYDSQFEIINPSRLSEIKQARIEEAKANAQADSSYHNFARQKIKLQKISILKRGL